MYQIDKPAARKIMVEEQGYSPQKVDRLLADYPPIHEPLADAVKQWLEDRTISSVKVEGLEIQQVMQDQHYHFLVAIKKLNLLLDESTPTDERKRLLEDLRTPAIFL
ncbi:MAG TPA: hypothetical protein PLO13_08340 [Anaerolineaceae bacterium]|jgi:hypothetical protein|nr:hypothetical protein [Chloroflexota bacterium]HOT98984.1 hypothetical protein [bacterium]HQJ33350.1 hypothetical protein [Anaerolineaceae bacterium]